MFYCQVTGKLSEPGEKQHRIVVEQRPRVYTQRVYDDDMNIVTVEVGRGWEIIKEIVATEEGLALWNKRKSLDGG